MSIVERNTPDPELLLIGGCLLNPDAMADVTVSGSDFDGIAAGLIFDRMLERHEQGIGVTAALLCEDFPEHMALIWNSTNNFTEASRVIENNRAVQEHAIRRKVREACAKIAEWSRSQPVETLVDEARKALDEALALENQTVTSMIDDATEVIESHREGIAVVRSPWAELNDIIGGFGGGRVYTIGARPGTGKSAIASQIAYQLAMHGAVLFATMEMDRGEVYSRILSQQAELPYGQPNVYQWMIDREQEFWQTGRRDIRVLDSGTQSVASIRAAARSVSRETHLAAVVVDYLHLLSGPKAESEQVRITELSRALKTMAMDLGVPVIVLSQLNRGADGKPSLQHLRGSGAIEQDGDVVLFLYREQDANGNDILEDLYLYVAKNRQGRAGETIRLWWQGEFVRAMTDDR